VPVLLASARVSARSARRYQRLPGLLREALQRGVWVAAQSADDAERFCVLGVPRERVSVAGNIKFDRRPPSDLPARSAALRGLYAADRPTWVAGSTQEGEEATVLAAHRLLRMRLPQALLILAPRYPQRFDAVVAAVRAAGFSCARRSQALPAEPYAVLVLDTLGELVDFYAGADVAFVGGSLVPVGGHNLLEPAALGLPVLAGPHQFNSPDIARVLREYGALETVTDAAALAAALARLLADPELRARAGERARAAIEQNRGAIERVLRAIDVLLPLAVGTTVAGANAGELPAEAARQQGPSPGAARPAAASLEPPSQEPSHPEPPAAHPSASR
jgi:3-deoxy-D-manno-octulosonic-acid transferase